MPKTTPDNLRSPLRSDDPDIPRDIGLLAADVQAALVKKAPVSTTPVVDAAGRRIVYGTYVGTTDSSGKLVVPFAKAFRTGTSPIVVAVPGDSPGVDGAKTTFVSTPTPAGFTFNGMNASTLVRVNYSAYGEV